MKQQSELLPNAGIYILTNKHNGKQYVGQSENQEGVLTFIFKTIAIKVVLYVMQSENMGKKDSIMKSFCILE